MNDVYRGFILAMSLGGIAYSGYQLGRMKKGKEDARELQHLVDKIELMLKAKEEGKDGGKAEEV